MPADALRRNHADQQPRSAPGEKQTACASDDREHHALGEQLLQQPCPPGADRQPDRDLTPAGKTAREQHVRHVRARHDQHERYGKRHDGEHGFEPLFHERKVEVGARLDADLRLPLRQMRLQ